MKVEPLLLERRQRTEVGARKLGKDAVADWLITTGFYPESYVLPPCFSVFRSPPRSERYLLLQGGSVANEEREPYTVHFPKTRFGDRKFSVVDPQVNNDIAHLISENWPSLVATMIPATSQVVSYSFPLPLDREQPGVITDGRSHSSIYQFLEMLDQDIASFAHKYKLLIRTDIKSFYPTIYTHSIPWAIHGKRKMRIKANRHDMRYWGNQLDALFQRANDGRTNGIPIGPAVSDLIAEAVAGAVDRTFSERVRNDLDFQAIRFKDDYRILVNSDDDGQEVVRALREALAEFHLELSDEKTTTSSIPLELFRDWVPRYLAVYPGKAKLKSWQEFWRLYLNVLEIEKQFPGSGMIDRFLGNITYKDGRLLLRKISEKKCRRIVSMLLMLGNLRLQSFPKVVAVIESLYQDPRASLYCQMIADALIHQYERLTRDTERNKYQLLWLGYFFASNGIAYNNHALKVSGDCMLKSIATGRPNFYSEKRYTKDFKLFESPKQAGRRTSLFNHVRVFPSHRR